MKSVGNYSWEEKNYIQDPQLVPQTTAISAFHSELISHRLVLKVTLSVAPKWL